MPRLTRRETQEQTRSRLVATATELFLTDGYNATSLGEVAEAAGYTKGAVYSNFATKHALGLAVLEVVQEQRVSAIVASYVEGKTFEERIAAFGRWAEANIGDVGWTALEVEFATSTRHIAEVRSALADRRQLITGVLADLLQDQADTFGIALPAPALDVATHLLALGIGLGVQRAFDPTLEVKVLVDELNRLAGAAR
jgi:AcrR family transcriptional regulator